MCNVNVLCCMFVTLYCSCQGKTRIQLQVQLKYLLKSQNTRLGRGRGPGAVIEGKERWQEEVFSPIKPPVTPWGREGKA